MHQTVCRQSYTIYEIAAMRSMSEQAVLDDIYHGQLRAHIWLPMMVIEECKKYRIGDKLLYEHNQRPYEGYVALYPHDVRQIMRQDKVILRSFPGHEEDIEINIKSGAPDYHVMKNDILILQESLSHLKLKEKVQDVRVTAIARLDEIWPELKKKPATTTHDPHFQNVSFKGHHYAFGLVQADIIKQLYHAAQSEHPKVHFKTLFVKSGAQSMRIRDVFKSQPGWKEIICHDNRGYYWLHPDFVDPPSTTPSPS
jgi:hypothetical protein